MMKRTSPGTQVPAVTPQAYLYGTGSHAKQMQNNTPTVEHNWKLKDIRCLACKNTQDPARIAWLHLKWMKAMRSWNSWGLTAQIPPILILRNLEPLSCWKIRLHLPHAMPHQCRLRPSQRAKERKSKQVQQARWNFNQSGSFCSS